MAGLLCAGCGGKQDQYSLERELYGIKKKAQAIMTNPEATPPAELKRVVDALTVFMNKESQKTVAVEARFIIAGLYKAKKEFPKAHETVAGIIAAYPKYTPICAQAMFLDGQIWEDQGDWAQALTKYQELMRTYPRTPRGMEVPLYIAAHYRDKLQPDKMIEAYHEAVAYYSGMADKYPGSEMSFQCRIMVAKVQAELKEWPEAVRTLETVVEEFKDKMKVDAIRVDIANIYGVRLKDKAKAEAILQKVAADNPKEPVGEVARKMLEKLSLEKP